jgi:hypothetical protein
LPARNAEISMCSWQLSYIVPKAEYMDDIINNSNTRGKRNTFRCGYYTVGTDQKPTGFLERTSYTEKSLSCVTDVFVGR